MKIIPYIRAIYDGDRVAAAANPEVLYVETVVEKSGMDFMEYHAVITNVSDRMVVLDSVSLLEIDDLSVCEIGDGPYDVYRSGRHKNDMPGVFTIGCKDERLADVSSVMAESGDGMAGGDNCQVVSDHLSILKGNAGKCFAVEFMTGRDQLFQTRFLLDEQGAFVKLCAEVLFHVQLLPGASVATETIRLAVTGRIQDEIEQFAERKALLYGRRNSRHPAVFCTWYYYGLTVTYEDVLCNLKIMRDRKLPYDVFQVDEGWEVTLGEYEPNHKFPVPMKQVADQIREAGFIPGIWSSPFVAHETASVWRTHPEWILREKSGKPCLFPMNDTVYYVFDITNAETYDYFRELYHRFTFVWGYTYHKLDFTRAAVIYEDADFADKTVTLAQAYYRAVKAIREGMGEDAFFLMCGGLYDPIIGLVDAQRTGSDVLSMWSSTVNKGGKTAPYTIRQSMLRYYMNRWWANDPDALMIRKKEAMERNLRLTYGLLNDEEVKTSVINQFAGGGIMCQTEPLDKIGDERLMEIRHILPVVDTVVTPLDIMSRERFPGAVDVYVKNTDVHCICMINWSDTEDKKVALRPADILAGAQTQEDAGGQDAEYVVCDFYTGEYRTGVHAADTIEFSPLKPHSATVLKVEKRGEKPIIVASDGHYAMGAECSILEVSDGKLKVGKDGRLPVETHYRILLPEGWRYGDEELVSITMKPDCGYVESEVCHV